MASSLNYFKEANEYRKHTKKVLFIDKSPAICEIRTIKFEFDPAKSASNKAKHGLDFIDAQALWKGDRIRVSAKTTEGEARYALIGKIGRIHHTVIVTYRGASIRIVSARPSSKNEIEIYERNKKS